METSPSPWAAVPGLDCSLEKKLFHPTWTSPGAGSVTALPGLSLWMKGWESVLWGDALALPCVEAAPVSPGNTGPALREVIFIMKLFLLPVSHYWQDMNFETLLLVFFFPWKIIQCVYFCHDCHFIGTKGLSWSRWCLLPSWSLSRRWEWIGLAGLRNLRILTSPHYSLLLPSRPLTSEFGRNAELQNPQRCKVGSHQDLKLPEPIFELLRWLQFYCVGWRAASHLCWHCHKAMMLACAPQLWSSLPP